MNKGRFLIVEDEYMVAENLRSDLIKMDYEVVGLAPSGLQAIELAAKEKPDLALMDIKLSGEWISEKDLPGGPTFFRGPHLLPTNLISNRFGNDLQSFCERCKKLGGTQLQLADAAFSFIITKDIPVAVLYWIGDEEFPAEAKILYDKSIAEPLPLDIVFALAFEVCNRIGSA